jgi:hypothetical protein
MGEMINAFSILVGKPDRKRSLGRPRRRWECNVKMGFKEVVWEGVDWTRLVQGKGTVVGCCEHGDEPSGFIKGEFLD